MTDEFIFDNSFQKLVFDTIGAVSEEEYSEEMSFVVEPPTRAGSTSISDTKIEIDFSKDSAIKPLSFYPNWTTLHLGLPMLVGNHYQIPVKTNVRKLENDSDLTAAYLEANDVALTYLLQFFCKVYTKEQKEAFLSLKNYSTDWYINGTKNSSIHILVSINKDEFETEFDQKNRNKYVADFDTSFKINIKALPTFVEAMKQKLQKYAAEYNELVKDYGLKAEIEVFGEKHDIQILKNYDFQKAIDMFTEFQIRVNKLFEYNDKTKEGTFSLNVSSNNYKIRSAFIKDEKLDISFNYFLESGFAKDSQFVSLICNVGTDANALKQNYAWHEFLTKFVVPAPEISLEAINGILAAISFAKQTANKVSNTLSKFNKKANSFLENVGVTNPLTGNRYSGFMDGGWKLTKSKKRLEESDFIIDNITADFLNPVTPDYEDLEELLKNMWKMNWKRLVQELKKCISFDFEFKCPSFDFHLPRLPQFPCINIYLFLRINLEKLILDFLYDILQWLINLILDAIKKFCEDSSGNKANYGHVPQKDAVEKLPFDELMKEFLKDLFDILTPGQMCSLLQGNPTNETVEIVLDLLSESKYAPLRVEIYDRPTIIAFFRNIGELIGAESLARICGQSIQYFPEFDDCNSMETFTEMQKKFYRARGIGEQYVDQLVMKQEDEKQQIINAIQQIPSLLAALPQMISDSIDEISPAAIIGKDMPMAKIVKGLFDRILEEYNDAYNDIFVKYDYNDRKGLEDGTKASTITSEIFNEDKSVIGTLEQDSLKKYINSFAANNGSESYHVAAREFENHNNIGIEALRDAAFNSFKKTTIKQMKNLDAGSGKVFNTIYGSAISITVFDALVRSLKLHSVFDPKDLAVSDIFVDFLVDKLIETFGKLNTNKYLNLHPGSTMKDIVRAFIDVVMPSVKSIAPVSKETISIEEFVQKYYPENISNLNIYYDGLAQLAKRYVTLYSDKFGFENDNYDKDLIRFVKETLNALRKTF